ncbi:MAG: glycoside hydrolase family 88 protein [Paludibacter sp.]|nr:glycoside hydrolase family 88 protein [Paludibacter sp.]
MKKSIMVISIFCSFLCTANAQSLPTKQQVLEKMVLANNYFTNKWPDPTVNIVTDKSRPSNLWTRGTYYEGLMQLYSITADAKLLKYSVDWGTYHHWQPTYTGTTVTRNADNQCCGQTYLELFQLDPTKAERIATMQTSIDAMLNSSKSNDWWWIDALHMAMPVFAKFGVIKNDSRYYEKMYDLYNYTKSQAKGVGLYNPADSLWYRDSVYLPPKTSPNGLPVYWSRGNGWVFAALTRTLDVIPVTASHRDEYISTFKKMAAKLIRIQREDGFWNCNLGDANDYGGKESSGTVFFIYGLAWGINNGILDSITYYPSVTKAWNGLINYALHPDGSIGYMQSSGSKPSDGQPLSYTKMPNFEDFGLGGFLLAGSEVYKLAKVSNDLTSENKLLVGNRILSAYPNPFSEYVNINYIPTNKNSRIYILNSNGQRVFSFSKESSNPVNLIWKGTNSAGINLPNGLYVINLQNANQNQSLKIILKR